jgi:hypothetical protein
MVSLNGMLHFIFKIFRNDGRKYRGQWKKGKQHGAGEFFNAKDNVWKSGVWEAGNRIKWTNTKGDLTN